MFVVNEDLIRRLHKMLGLSQRRFSEETFSHNQVWPQRMTFFNRMLLSDLVTISNHWHIPIRYLIRKDTETEPLMSVDDIVYQGDWREVKLNVDAFRRVYQTACARKGRKNVHDALGVTASCIWRWLTVRFTVRAQMVCDFCNFTGVDLLDFVRDPNWKAMKSAPLHAQNQPSPTPVYEGFFSAGVANTEDVLASLTRLQSENMVLSASVCSLRQQMEQVRGILLTLDGVSPASTAPQTVEILRAFGFAGCESLFTPYGWQGDAWGEGVPTLEDFVARCNERQESTSRFLVLPAVAAIFNAGALRPADGAFQPILLHDDALDYVMKAAGLDVPNARSVSVADFCCALNALHLTPACCIDDVNTCYPPLFADKMVRELAGK